MEIESKFIKRKMPIDYLPDEPYKALEEFWHLQDLAHLIHREITYWFYMALSHESAIYHYGIEVRATFIEFFSDLLPLIEANFCFHISAKYYNKYNKRPEYDIMIKEIHEKLCHDYSCIYLKIEEVMDPLQVINRFCANYPINYVRRELWDFLDAVQFYSGSFRAMVSKHAFSEYYMRLLTIVEISYVVAEKPIKSK